MRRKYQHSAVLALMLSVSAIDGLSADKSVGGLPTSLSVKEGDNNHIIIDGYDSDIRLDGPSFMDWDYGSLTVYGAKEGTYNPTFYQGNDSKQVTFTVKPREEFSTKNTQQVSETQTQNQSENQTHSQTFSKPIIADGGGLESLPKKLSIKAGDNDTIFLKGFDSDIKMDGAWYFDWDVGSLTAYNAPLGEHRLRFSRDGDSKEVMVTVLSHTLVEKKEVNNRETTASNHRVIEVHPGESIEAAIKLADAGDSVLVHGGTYDEKIDMEVQGTADKWVTISNYPGEKPILYTSATGKVFNFEKSAYLKVNGFVIKEPKGIGIRVSNSHHVIVSNNEIYGLGKRGNPGGGAHAIVADGRKGKESHDILITGNYLHHNLTRFDANGNKTDDETLTVKGAVSYTTVENNRVVDNQFIGIDIIGPELDPWGASHHNVIRNNYIARNSKTFRYGDALYIDGGKNHIAEYNTVEDNGGSGVSTSQEHAGEVLENITIRYNKIGNQQEDQVYIGDTSNSYSKVKNIFFENNYVYATKAADNAHIGIGVGNNVQMNGNYFELVGEDIIRQVYDSGRPDLQSNSITANSYSSAYIKEKIESLGWGSVGEGVVGENSSIKSQAGADMSRIPPSNSSALVLGDREITSTRVDGAGQRIQF